MFYSISASTRILSNCCGIRFENFRQTIHSVRGSTSYQLSTFFLKESARLSPGNSSEPLSVWFEIWPILIAFADAVTRQNLVPYTFSGPDGPHVPAGNCISVLLRAIMRDPAHYSSPKTFEPLRFATNVTAAGKTDTEANATHAEYTEVLQIPAVGPRQTCLVSPFPIVWQKDSCLHLHVPPQSSSIHSAFHTKPIQFMWDQYGALLRLHRAQTRCGGDFAELRPQARAREWRCQERNLLHLRFLPHSQGLDIDAEEII